MKLSRVVGIAVLCGAVVACQSGSSKPERERPSAPALLDQGRVRPSLPPPLGLDAEAVAPLEGEALAKARLPLDEALAAVPQPEYLRAPATQPAERGEPPVAAQRAYLDARLAWREGKSYDALRQLQSALRVAPNEPKILRLLGEIYTSINNKVRGAQYLREAIQADPGDAEALFWLGRFAIEAGDWPEAVATLDAARRAAGDHNRVLTKLLRYYLAAALAQEGHIAAAIGEFQGFLSDETRPMHYSRLTRDLAVLEGQQASVWLTLGDLHHRLGDAPAASEAYRRAADAAEGEIPLDLVRRLVYTQLRLGHDAAARALVLDRVAQSDGDPATLQLVRYLTEHTGGTEAFARHLEEVYRREGHSAPLALAIAELMSEDDAAGLLTDHLRRRPQDQNVWAQLLRSRLLPAGADEATPAEVRRALATTVDLMSNGGEYADEFALEFVRAAEDPAALTAVIEAMPSADRAQPNVELIYGVALAGLGRAEEAKAALQRAMAAPDSPARLQLAKLLILQGDFKGAATLLQPLAESRDPDVVTLRVRVLSETGNVDEALALLDEMMRQGASDVGLVLQKAALQLSAEDASGAEQTLLDALNVHPQEERVYEALLNLYDPPSGESPLRDRDSLKQWNRLVRRMLGTIPYSRIARLVRAELHEAKSELDEAEALLKELLEEDARDTRAMRLLLQIYVRSNRKDEALGLLDRLVEAHPRDTATLLIAGAFYRQLDEPQKVLELAERYLQTRPDGEARDVGLAKVALERGRPSEALEHAERALDRDSVADPVEVVRLLGRALWRLDRLGEAEKRYAAATKRFPQHAADLRYGQASLLTTAGDRPRAERLMLDLLAEHPDHAPTNNDLGYHWVSQNRDLERAKAMIQRAVDADPNTAAYLDSLGWAYYKLGQFDEAHTWLSRAREAQGGAGQNPVIVDHLGDALYRLGREPQAIRVWEEARVMIKSAWPAMLEHYANRLYESGEVADAVTLWGQVRRAREGDAAWDDPEMNGLEGRLTAKIRAAQGDEPAPVAPLPGEAEVEPALGDEGNEAVMEPEGEPLQAAP